MAWCRQVIADALGKGEIPRSSPHRRCSPWSCGWCCSSHPGKTRSSGPRTALKLSAGHSSGPGAALSAVHAALLFLCILFEIWGVEHRHSRLMSASSLAMKSRRDRPGAIGGRNSTSIRRTLSQLFRPQTCPELGNRHNRQAGSSYRRRCRPRAKVRPVPRVPCGRSGSSGQPRPPPPSSRACEAPSCRPTCRQRAASRKYRPEAAGAAIRVQNHHRRVQDQRQDHGLPGGLVLGGVNHLPVQMKFA